MRMSDWSSDVCSSDLRLDSTLVKNFVPFGRWIGTGQRAHDRGRFIGHGSFLRMGDGALDVRRSGIRSMIDAIRFGRLVIDAQHLAAPAQAQLARHQMNDDESVANVERTPRFGTVDRKRVV